MNTTAINFNNVAYTEASLNELSGPALVELYNNVVSTFRNGESAPNVRRFADKTTAIARTWKLLQRYAEANPEVEAEAQAEPQKVETVNETATPAPVAIAPAVAGPTTLEEVYWDKIFGYSWDAIQRAQRGDLSGLRRRVSNAPSDDWTPADQEALDKHESIAGLEAAGFYGVADRARRLGKAAGRQVAAPKAKAAAAANAKAEKARAPRGTNLAAPGHAPIQCREGSKQAILLDMLARQNGATLAELIDALSGGNKPWTEATVRSGFGWDMKLKGYGVRSSFDADGTERFHLVVPEGHAIPAHKPLKGAAKADFSQTLLSV